VKKGRHRRYEEARAVKHSSTELHLDDIGFTEKVPETLADDDPYAEIAARYGAFDDEEDAAEEDSEEA
jgi:hypothetical protein